MMHRILSAARYLFRRNKVEHDIDVELQYHYDRQTEENIRKGMPPAEARLEG